MCIRDRNTTILILVKVIFLLFTKNFINTQLKFYYIILLVWITNWYTRVCDFHIADISFLNPSTFSWRADANLATEHVLYLPPFGAVTVGVFDRGGECVVTVCCLLI